MKRNFLIRAFLGLAIMALGGILLLRNLGIITFDNWHLFWGTFWAGAFLLAGLSVLVGARRCSQTSGVDMGIATSGYRCINWAEHL